MPESVTTEHSNDPAAWNQAPVMPAQVNGHAAMPDLDALDLDGRAEKGFELAISNPDPSRPLDIRIRLRGRDSGALHQLDVQQMRARMEQEAQTPGAYYQRSFTSDQIEKAVVATLGWSDFAAFGQAPYPYSAENARKLYTRFQGWILVEVINAINDRKKLFQDTPTG